MKHLKKQAIELGGLITKTHPKNALAFDITGNILNIYDEKPDALATFKKAVEIDPNNYAVWERIIMLNFELNDFETAIKDAKEAIELFPNQPRSYYYSGLAYNQLDKPKEAVKVLKKGVLMTVNDESLAGSMYLQMGDAYNELKDYENSDKSFEKGLKLNPKNATMLNNYAYYLSIRGDKLDKAAEMSKLSNDIEPGNPSFQDTYGWILFKQENYKEAEKWLVKALQNGGEGNSRYPRTLR